MKDYGAITNQNAKSYIRILGQRLQNAFPYAKHRFSSYEIIILNSTTPAAFSPGGSFIFLSKGLILSLTSEEELAFVIAHEMAHQELKHTALAELKEKKYTEYKQIDAYMSEQNETLELEADKFAAATLAQAGYDPVLATQAIFNAARKRQDLQRNPQVLQLLERRRMALQKFLQKSRVRSYGLLLPQRNFLYFQSILRS
ncbi:MAG: M48 family metalloprotease [SAR324 cluster bacterium]|uniref:M48 family metalloprotease n=1 Tax=SAR324 cluster bacterium TaxID=2024889 RepID=A0A7X9IMM4_9DELT|nr:M48 family metalloprotease [SAR324 cluster bacterium]